jgi:hypothetical protein
MTTLRIGGALALLAGACTGALASGPDVTLSDIQQTTNYGTVGGIRAYAISSHTCNIGNQNLLWVNSGTPGLGMNLYRIEDGRMVQIGLSFAKTACCAAAGSGCGMSCNGAGGSVLGAGCLDVYGSSYNGGQTRLGPRSAMNSYSGAFTSYAGVSGDAIFRRLQVRQDDINIATHPNARFIIEGVYVATDDAAAGNSANNATYKLVNRDTSYNMNPTGTAQIGIPAIYAWRHHGLGTNQIDPSVIVSRLDIDGEGIFHVAYKVTNLGNGTWRYDYAVYNLSSDRSGGSLTIPVPAGVTVSNVGFSAPFYHSNEIYNNDPWVFTNTGNGTVRWSTPETFAQNANSSAIRWGTMYNFWFEANTGPQAGTATLGLFKPFTPASIGFVVQGPSPAATCYANCDQSTQSPLLNILDFNCFLNRFAAGDAWANCDQSSQAPVLNVLDFNCFLNKFAAGCP